MTDLACRPEGVGALGSSPERLPGGTFLADRAAATREHKAGRSTPALVRIDGREHLAHVVAIGGVVFAFTRGFTRTDAEVLRWL